MIKRKFDLSGFSLMVVALQLHLMKSRLHSTNLTPIERFELINRIEATEKYLYAMKRRK